MRVCVEKSSYIRKHSLLRRNSRCSERRKQCRYFKFSLQRGYFLLQRVGSRFWAESHFRCSEQLLVPPLFQNFKILSFLSLLGNLAATKLLLATMRSYCPFLLCSALLSYSALAMFCLLCSSLSLLLCSDHGWSAMTCSALLHLLFCSDYFSILTWPWVLYSCLS